MSRFPSARAGPKDRDQVLPRTYFAPPKKPGKAAIVSRKLLRGLGDSLFMGHMAWRRGRGGAGQPCLLLPRQPHLLSADPGATLSLSLSLSTRPGSLSDLSRGPGPPLPPVTASFLVRTLVVSGTAGLQLSQYFPMTPLNLHPHRARPLLMTACSVSAAGARGSLVVRSLTRPGLGVEILATATTQYRQHRLGKFKAKAGD